MSEGAAVWPEVAGIVHHLGLAIELMAVVVVTYASAETFVVVVGLVLRRLPLTGSQGFPQWLRFLQLLVLGLTFQLAADLVHITVARGWEPIGHAFIVAVLRTFLAYFIGRDLREYREMSDAHASAG